MVHDHGAAAGHGTGGNASSAGSYDQRYRSHSSLWSGDPNPQLVAEAAALPPGVALDAGCGEGADAIWLAGCGWQVDAVDFSSVALERAAARAAEDGPGTQARIRWLHQDLTGWVPAPASYDLVSAQFLQLPSAVRGPVFRSLADAVAPAGTLLIVGHHASDLGTSVRRPPVPDVYFTAEELASSLLDPDRWDVVASGTRPRSTAADGGGTVTVHDTVLRACKRA
jgi:SAM-dependent methyltransferase